MVDVNSSQVRPFFLWRHLNKLRWVTLTTVFLMLVAIPMLTIYQQYVAAHAYRLLTPGQQHFYDVMETLTSPFVRFPADDLDAIKGTTWSGQFFGWRLSDPLAVVAQISAGLELYWPFLLTALIPVGVSIIFGRIFCGWICPATFLYELNSNFSTWLRRFGLHAGNRRLDRRFKYLVLIGGVILSALTGSMLFAAVYPPAVIGRELYFAIALSGFGGGTLFFLGTLLFDSLVARRGFCRYICPGGALYSLLGRYRLLRIRRIVEPCNDCGKCNAVCEFGLDPLRDDFGQECNNCAACIAVCPQDAMTFVVAVKDLADQGPGHLSHHYRREHSRAVPAPPDESRGSA